MPDCWVLNAAAQGRQGHPAQLFGHDGGSYLVAGSDHQHGQLQRLGLAQHDLLLRSPPPTVPVSRVCERQTCIRLFTYPVAIADSVGRECGTPLSHSRAGRSALRQGRLVRDLKDCAFRAGNRVLVGHAPWLSRNRQKRRCTHRQKMTMMLKARPVSTPAAERAG
jgi:hypothetical protein